MSLPAQRRVVAVVTACMTSAGFPEFTLCEVAVTEEEIENGVHYELAEYHARKAGYDEPFVHFGEDEAPDFLHPAVRRYLELPPAVNPVPQEDNSCPASSK